MSLTPSEFRSRYKGKIGLLDPDAQSIIEELQPYHRGEDFASHPLWKLNRLSNVDKHRVLHLTLMAVSTYTDFPDTPHLPGKLTINFGPFRHDTIIASYTPFAGEEFDPRVHMDPLLTFGIAFDGESTVMSGSVTTALRWLYHHVANRVVPRLEPFLTQ